MGRGRRGIIFQEQVREWRLPGLLCADDMILCDKSEEDLRVMVCFFVEVCKRRDLRVNAIKSNVMVLGGK